MKKIEYNAVELAYGDRFPDGYLYLYENFLLKLIGKKDKSILDELIKVKPFKIMYDEMVIVVPKYVTKWFCTFLGIQNIEKALSVLKKDTYLLSEILDRYGRINCFKLSLLEEEKAKPYGSLRDINNRYRDILKINHMLNSL